MATTYKVLAQSYPSASTNTDIYTVPAATQAIVSSIIVANQNTSNAITYRIAIRKSGATLANQHYISYEVPVAAANSTALTLGLTMAATDVITVYSSSGTVSFSVFGSEIA